MKSIVLAFVSILLALSLTNCNKEELNVQENQLLEVETSDPLKADDLSKGPPPDLIVILGAYVGYTSLNDVFNVVSNFSPLVVNHPVYGCFELAFEGYYQYHPSQNYYIVYKMSNFDYLNSYPNFLNSDVDIEDSPSCNCGSGGQARVLTTDITPYYSSSEGEMTISTAAITTWSNLWCF